MQVTCLILLLLVPSWLVTISSDSSLKVAEVQKREEVRQIKVGQLKTLLENKQPVTILDVRMDQPYAESLTKIKGAKRIQPDNIEAHLKEVPRDKEIVTYCTCPDEASSARVARILLANGFKNVRVLKGGWGAWVEAGGATEPK